MRTRAVTPVSAASVVTPSKHSPGPSPYIGWKLSKPHTPSKPSCSANWARPTTSDHGMRCCAMSSPNCICPSYHAHRTAEIVIKVARVWSRAGFETLMTKVGYLRAGGSGGLRHHAAQVVGRERAHHRVDRGPGGRRTPHPEERRQL